MRIFSLKSFIKRSHHIFHLVCESLIGYFFQWPVLYTVQLKIHTLKPQLSEMFKEIWQCQ